LGDFNGDFIQLGLEMGDMGGYLIPISIGSMMMNEASIFGASYFEIHPYIRVYLVKDRSSTKPK